MSNKNITLAIDGTAASGKGTLARSLSKEFNFAYLDTGKLYRASALIISKENIHYENIAAIKKIIKNFDFSNFDFNNERLKSDEIGKLASMISGYKELRKILLEYQKYFSCKRHDDQIGVILDGRDIGTVVLPEADIKFFITASLSIRAERRWKELISLGQSTIRSQVEEDIRDRDERDIKRKYSPLVAAPDAILLDTTNLNANESFLLAKKHVEQRLN
jgi:cytidylate kinase